MSNRNERRKKFYGSICIDLFLLITAMVGFGVYLYGNSINWQDPENLAKLPENCAGVLQQHLVNGHGCAYMEGLLNPGGDSNAGEVISNNGSLIDCATPVLDICDTPTAMVSFGILIFGISLTGFMFAVGCTDFSVLSSAASRASLFGCCSRDRDGAGVSLLLVSTSINYAP